MSVDAGDDSARMAKDEASSSVAQRGSAQLAEAVAQPVTTALSHELRTPLNAVAGSAELLLEGRLTPLQRRLCEAIQVSSGAMLAVIDDLVALAAREDAGLALPEQSADFRQVCEEALQLVRPLAEQHGVVLLFPDTAVPGDGKVGVDRLRLRNLMVCALRKAIMLAADGRVILRLTADAASVGPHERAPLCLVFEIAGPSLTGKLHAPIAARFTVPNGSGVEHVGEETMGFALLHAVTRAMGGMLGLAEPAGRAADGLLRVALRLPAAGASLVAPPPPSGTDDRPEPTPSVPSISAAGGETTAQAAAPTVLIVDDHQTNRLIASHLLRHFGCTVLEAVSGVEAIETVAQTRPDIVLMDLSMPVMDGAETTRRIRAMEAEMGRAPAIIVALTANALREHKVLCRDAGMDDFLTKPIRRKDIASLIERLAKGAAEGRAEGGTP